MDYGYGCCYFFAFKLTYSRITAKLERRYTFILWWGDRDSGRSKKSEGGGGNRLSISISAFVLFSISAKSEGSPPCPSTSGVPGRAQSKVATRWIKKITLKQKQFYHDTHKNSNLICFCKPYQLFTMYIFDLKIHTAWFWLNINYSSLLAHKSSMNISPQTKSFYCLITPWQTSNMLTLVNCKLLKDF